MKIAQLMTGRPRRAHRLPALALPDLAALFEPQADVSLGSVSESNRPATTSLSEHGRPPQKALHLGSIGFPAAASNHTPLPTYSETRVWGFGLADETRIEIERSVSTGTTWACGSRSGRTASGSGEFRIFDPAGNALSTSAYGWTRLFQGREYIPMLDAYDFRARTLWPELGRFGQEDPARSDPRLSLYQGFNGNWPNVTDPTGKYATDFHYYAIYYLARASGFQQRFAKEIAWASQYVDDSEYTNPLNPANWKSRRLQTFHFAALGFEPTRRRNTVVRTNVGRAINLRRLIPLGIALHTYADSFGHEGYSAWTGSTAPGVINFFFPGHGSDGSEPDKPHNNVPKAIEAAKDIYEMLSALPGGGSWKEQPARPWAEVMRRIRGAFASVPDLSTSDDLQEEARCRVWRRLIEVDFSETARYVKTRPGPWDAEFLEAAQAQDDFIGTLARVEP